MNETLPAQLARLDLDRVRGYKELLDFYYGRQWAGRGTTADASRPVSSVSAGKD